MGLTCAVGVADWTGTGVEVGTAVLVAVGKSVGVIHWVGAEYGSDVEAPGAELE